MKTTRAGSTLPSTKGLPRRRAREPSPKLWLSSAKSLAEVAFRKAAETDLALIVRYSVTEFGREVAVTYLDALDDLWVLLTTHPRIGAVFGRRGKQIVRAYSCGSHRVFYTVRGNRVWVVRILHQSMHHERVMRVAQSR